MEPQDILDGGWAAALPERPRLLLQRMHVGVPVDDHFASPRNRLSPPTERQAVGVALIIRQLLPPCAAVANGRTGGRYEPGQPGTESSPRERMNGNQPQTETNLDRGVSFAIVTIPRAILGILILAGIAINAANVAGRYLFLSPIIWAEEILIYIMVWTVFVGAVLVTWDGRHLKMDFFTVTLPQPYKGIMAFLSTIMFLAVCIFVVPQAWTVFSLMMRLDQRSVVAEIPMAIPHFAIVLGFVLMLIAVLYRFRSHATGRLESDLQQSIQAAEKQQV
jgi:TRAP-type C4-dicarboxylate transport system permease small subunit